MSFFLKSDYEYIVYTLYILLVCSTTIIMYKKISLEFCKNSMRRRREKEGHSCKLDSNKAVWHTSLGMSTMALLLPYYKYRAKKEHTKALHQLLKRTDKLFIYVMVFIHSRGKSLLELWVTIFLPDR